MKWPILGILIVFCLQLAFTAYVSIDRESETMVAVNEVTGGTDNIVNAPEIYSEAEFVVSAPKRQKHVRFDEAILVSSKNVAKIPAAKAANSFKQSVASQKPFESITITYSRVVSPASEPINFQSSSRAIPQLDKRSFVSKSVSVLKKPYGWLKALGSRVL